MKIYLINAIHKLFQYHLLEKILLLFVRNKYVSSSIVKLIPPNTLYSKDSYRLAKNNGFSIMANLYDYNDWKAYWGIKEIERERLYSLAKSCSTIIDVGVNNGWVIMNLAKISDNGNGFVYGFEPHPQTYARCLENVSRNNILNVEIFNLGCGHTEGELKMISPVASNSGQNRIISEIKYQENLPLQVIKIIKLDDHIGLSKMIDLIKIDVEGFEMNVLLGAKNIIKKWKPKLFVELDDGLLKSNDSSAKDVFEFLRNMNYEIHNANNNEIISNYEVLLNCHLDIICY